MKYSSIILFCAFCFQTEAYKVTQRAPSGSTPAITVYSTNGLESDVQAAVKVATNGALIEIPAGSFTWNKPGVTVNTAVSIQGAGVGKTIITGTAKLEQGLETWSAINLNSDGANAQISDIQFKGVYSIFVSGTYTSAPYRIHDCTFSAPKQSAILVEVSGNGPGLIDHCTFTGGNASEMIHNLGVGISGWHDNVYPGSASALYVENCTFNKAPADGTYFYGTTAVAAFYGARTVMRYCVLNACQIDEHGTAGEIGTRWWEFYNNTFYTPPEMYQSNYFDLRGGSGVVFNNVNTGSNKQQGVIGCRDENGGKTPLYFGRGCYQHYSPVYIWNNGPVMPVVSGSSNVIAGRDYFVSQYEPSSMIKWQLTTDNANTTYTYKPYVYPHPLDNDPTSSFGPSGQ
jgi:hypothetical protein